MDNKLMFFPKNKTEIDEYVDTLLELTLKTNYESEKMLLHSLLHMLFSSEVPKGELAPHTVLHLLQLTADEDENGLTLTDKMYMVASNNIDNPGAESVWWYLKNVDIFPDIVIRLMSVFQFYDKLFTEPVYDNNGKTLLFYPNHLKATVFEIPEGVEKIVAHAVVNNPYLQTIKIPKSLKIIEKLAFGNIVNLKGFIVNKENSLFYSEYGILYQNKKKPMILKYPNATKSTYVVIPARIKKVKAFAFEGCQNLKEVTIESSETELEDMAFFDCRHIDSIAVLDGKGDVINPAGFDGMSMVDKKTEDAETPEETEDIAEPLMEIKTPTEIKKMFDDYIVGHDDAKRTLSVAVYSHILRCNNPNGGIGKSNILLCGPTGCGKTEFARTIAKCLNVPFVTADATSITETGMKGNDPTDMLKDLLVAANNNLTLAQNGIIYIDEIDKLASFGENSHRESYSKAVQQGLLRIVEGGIIPIRIDNPMQQYTINFDTSNVLFIVGGAFSHMNSNNTNRKKQIGFIQQEAENVTMQTSVYEAKDFMKFGMTQEFIGRFPVIVQLKQLTEDEIYRIMVEPKNSVVSQYEKLVKCIGPQLVFEEELLRHIAREAIKMGTGARGLRTVIEKLMENIIFELPEKKNVKKVKIHKGMLEKELPIYIETERPKKKKKIEQIEQYE